MSTKRAKRKRPTRSRTPAAAGPERGGDRPAAPRPPAPATAQRPPVRAERPSRLDVRDGVARPRPIWAPFPLTEIGLLAGLAVFGAGALTEGRRGALLLGIGALMLTVVVTEMCLREHFAGFRSHSLLLALVAVAAVHTVLLLTTDFWRGPVVAVVDLAAWAGLSFLLYRRYEQAHARAPRVGR